MEDPSKKGIEQIKYIFNAPFLRGLGAWTLSVQALCNLDMIHILGWRCFWGVCTVCMFGAQ